MAKTTTITLKDGSTIEKVVSIIDHSHPLMHAFFVVTYISKRRRVKRTVAKKDIVSNQ